MDKTEREALKAEFIAGEYKLRFFCVKVLILAIIAVWMRCFRETLRIKRCFSKKCKIPKGLSKDVWKMLSATMKTSKQRMRSKTMYD